VRRISVPAPGGKTVDMAVSGLDSEVSARPRGRWGCVLGGDPDCHVTAMRARELARTPIVVAVHLDLVGDRSGRTTPWPASSDSGPRRTVLRRTADDTDPIERVVVAGADLALLREP
jgi:ribosome biogenesis GTPase / thiamine phosphate phosphatase